MNKKVLITIKKELRASIRDKKSLMMMTLTPLMIPLFIFMFSFVYDKIMQDDTTNEKYVVGINYDMNDIEEEIIKDMDFETKKYISQDKMQEDYEEGKLVLYVIKKEDNYKIFANTKNQDSYYASSLFISYLDLYNNYLAKDYLVSINADINKVYNNINYSIENLEGTNDLVNQLITIGFIFSIMSISLTAIYCATDSTAGEKERGTLETLLTFPIKNEELIRGKYLAITFSCFITSLLSTLLVVISFTIAGKMFNIYKNTTLNFNFITITIALLIMIAYSIFISGLCISIASLSKTYKEAQSSLTPISLLTMIPMFLDILKVGMTPIVALIPLVNHSMLLKTIFCTSINSTDIINIIIMFISTIIYSIIIIKLIAKQYQSEKILFSI